MPGKDFKKGVKVKILKGEKKGCYGVIDEGPRKRKGKQNEWKVMLYHQEWKVSEFQAI